MKTLFALVTTSTLLLSLMPVRAEVLYPTLPCRVFLDSDFIQIPSQCGTEWLANTIVPRNHSIARNDRRLRNHRFASGLDR
jgi:hypothetical protein